MYDLLERASGTKQDFRPFWVQLTAYDPGSRYYTWTEQQFVPSTGSFIPLEGGRFGSNTLNPTFDVNGATFGIPTFALVTLANYDPTVDWRYAVIAAAPGTTLTDEYDNGTGVFTPVDTQYWSIKDFVLTQMIQTIFSVTGSPTGGNFTVTAFGLTFTINWNQDATSLQVILSAAFGPNSIVVATGGPLPNGSITVTVFVPPALPPPPPIVIFTLGVNNLTGGNNPKPSLKTKTPQPRFQTLGRTLTNVPIIANVNCASGVLSSFTMTAAFQDGLLQSLNANNYTLVLTGNPTGGSFQMFVDNLQPPLVIAWNATAASIQNQLNTAAPNDAWLVANGPLPGAVQIIGGGAITGLGNNNLTGGTNPTPVLTGP